MASGSGYPSNPKYFKEEMMCKVLSLDPAMVDIEKVVDVISEPIVEKVTLVETKVGVSNEGQILTGYKALVEMRIKQKVLYADQEVTCNIRGAHFEGVEALYVVLPAEVKGVSICNLLNRGQVEVTPYIEKVYTEKIDGRHLQMCMLMFVDIEVLI